MAINGMRPIRSIHMERNRRQKPVYLMLFVLFCCYFCRTFKLSDEVRWRGACCSEHDTWQCTSFAVAPGSAQYGLGFWLQWYSFAWVRFFWFQYDHFDEELGSGVTSGEGVGISSANMYFFSLSVTGAFGCSKCIFATLLSTICAWSFFWILRRALL